MYSPPLRRSSIKVDWARSVLIRAPDVCFDKQNAGDSGHCSNQSARDRRKSVLPAPCSKHLESGFEVYRDDEFIIVHHARINSKDPPISVRAGKYARTPAIVFSLKIAKAR